MLISPSSSDVTGPSHLRAVGGQAGWGWPHHRAPSWPQCFPVTAVFIPWLLLPARKAAEAVGAEGRFLRGGVLGRLQLFRTKSPLEEGTLLNGPTVQFAFDVSCMLIC